MVTTRVATGRDDPIDVHIGRRLRLAREAAGVSQPELGDALGVSFQQVQKYEWGRNRLSGARFFDAARLCGVKPNFFFEGMDPEMIEARDALLNRRSRPLSDVTLGNVMVEIVKRSDRAKGFVVLPKRWVVERTFAWLGRCRRLAKDWECRNAKGLAFLRLASIRLMMRRLCKKS